MRNTATALIDLTALTHTLQVVRGICPESRIMAMLKADAYGHGALPAARALSEADGFAVARLQEALELRQAGVTHRLLLLGTLLDQDDLALCSEQRIDVTAHDAGSLAAIAESAGRRRLRVWLKLDSGMHRLGLGRAPLPGAGRRLSALPGVTDRVHMPHFSSTHDMDSPAMVRQLARFDGGHATDPAHSVSG